MYVGAGRYDDGLREVQKSLELNPRLALAFHVIGFAYDGKGMYEEALAAQQQAAALSPGLLWGVGYAYARMGRRGEALKVATELPATSVNTLFRARIYAALGERAEALRWVESAFEQRHGNVPWIRNDPSLAPLLRAEPRYADLVRRMRLPG
jgi:tetratricopeptide (TPR) repeat protein